MPVTRLTLSLPCLSAFSTTGRPDARQEREALPRHLLPPQARLLRRHRQVPPTTYPTSTTYTRDNGLTTPTTTHTTYSLLLSPCDLLSLAASSFMVCVVVAAVAAIFVFRWVLERTSGQSLTHPPTLSLPPAFTHALDLMCQ